MRAQTAAQAGEFTAALHYGPGPHPDGSPQSVHAGGTTPKPAPPARGRRRNVTTTAQPSLLDADTPMLEPSKAQPQAPHKTTFRQAAQTPGSVAAAQESDGGVTESSILTYKGDGRGVWKRLRVPHTSHDGEAEVEAYNASRLLGMQIVPETVYAEWEGQPGTSQQYIDDLRIGHEVRKAYILHNEFIRLDPDRYEDLLVLDALTNNPDRHGANWGVDQQGRLWAIDHGHAGTERNGMADGLDVPDAGEGERRGWPWRSAEAMRSASADVSDYVAITRSEDNPAAWARDDPEFYAHVIPRHRANGEAIGGGGAGWRVTPAKLARWSKITRAEVVDAFTKDYKGSESTHTDKVARAWTFYGNLQRLLAVQGIIRYW